MVSDCYQVSVDAGLFMPVLILVLMEYGLGLGRIWLERVPVHVLILVLMEYGLGHKKNQAS